METGAEAPPGLHADPVRSGRQHRTFGPLNRFDQQIRDRHQHPKDQPDGRGVIYLAEMLETGLAEAFQGQGVEVGICPNMRAVAMAPAAAAQLLDITESGVMNIGAVAGLASGDYPRRATQRWGRAIYEDLQRFAGVRYRGAHQNGICVVVWERTNPLVFDAAEDFSLRDAILWGRVVQDLANQGRKARQITAAACTTCQQRGLKKKRIVPPRRGPAPGHRRARRRVRALRTFATRDERSRTQTKSGLNSSRSLRSR